MSKPIKDMSLGEIIDDLDLRGMTQEEIEQQGRELREQLRQEVFETVREHGVEVAVDSLMEQMKNAIFGESHDLTTEEFYYLKYVVYDILFNFD